MSYSDIHCTNVCRQYSIKCYSVSRLFEINDNYTVKNDKEPRTGEYDKIIGEIIMIKSTGCYVNIITHKIHMCFIKMPVLYKICDS